MSALLEMNDSEDLSAAGRTLLDRRRFLSQTATGLGSMALADLLQRDSLLAATEKICNWRTVAYLISNSLLTKSETTFNWCFSIVSLIFDQRRGHGAQKPTLRGRPCYSDAPTSTSFWLKQLAKIPKSRETSPC